MYFLFDPKAKGVFYYEHFKSWQNYYFLDYRPSIYFPQENMFSFVFIEFIALLAQIN